MGLNVNFVRSVFQDIEIRFLRKLEKALIENGSGRQVNDAQAALELLRIVQAEIEKEYEANV